MGLARRLAPTVLATSALANGCGRTSSYEPVVVDLSTVDSGIDVEDAGPSVAGRLIWAEDERILSAGVDGTRVGTLASGRGVIRGIAIEPVHRRIYWSESNAISRIGYDGTDHEVVVSGSDFGLFGALAVDADGDRLFWGDREMGLRAARLDGSGATTLALATTVSGVAVDPIEKKVYFADNYISTIARVGYDGTGFEVLYASPTYIMLGAIALDLTAKRVYWTEILAVKSANLDGTGVLTIATLRYGTGVAVDHAAGRLYFSETQDDSIASAGLDGSFPTIIYRNPNPLSNPGSLFIRPP